MKFNERRVGFGMGLICVLLVVFATLNMGADVIKEDFWRHTNQRTALVKVRNGSTNTYARQVYSASRPTNFVFNEFDNIGADTRGIVVDLSDTSGYMHGNTGFLSFDDMVGTMCIDGATGKWDIRIGLVVENDATNGTVWYFWAMSIRGPDRTCESITYRHLRTINMVMEGQTPTDWATGKIDADTPNWQNDVALPTFISGSTTPAPGDIVVEFDEIEDGSTLYVKGIQVEYLSHSGG